MSERDRWIYELGQRHPNLSFDVSDAYIERRGKDKDEIAKLKNLLIIRDGGGHDVDCKSNYNRQCNCGHDSVEEYFNEVAK